MFLLVSIVLLLVSIPFAPSAYAGNRDYSYCAFLGVPQTANSPSPPQYFSDVFLWASSPDASYDPKKRFEEYVRSSYPVLPVTEAKYITICQGAGDTEDKAREERSKKMKYVHYTGPVVETGWKMPTE
jgi:hypothetical protein